MPAKEHQRYTSSPSQSDLPASELSSAFKRQRLKEPTR